MDVLGYSLEEIGDVMDSSVPAVKAALNRGRARLRELAKEPEDASVPVLAEPERSLLAAYVDRFNARDFDAIRDMLADEVRLELVNRRRMNGRARSASTFTTTSASTIGILFRDWSTDARRFSYAIPRSIGSAGVFRSAAVGGGQAHEHPRFSPRPLRN